MKSLPSFFAKFQTASISITKVSFGFLALLPVLAFLNFPVYYY